MLFYFLFNGNNSVVKKQNSPLGPITVLTMDSISFTSPYNHTSLDESCPNTVHSCCYGFYLDIPLKPYDPTARAFQTGLDLGYIILGLMVCDNYMYFITVLGMDNGSTMSVGGINQ